jgi:hypothetical protein
MLDDNKRMKRRNKQQQKVYSILLIHLTLNILQIKMSTHIRSFGARASEVIATVELGKKRVKAGVAQHLDIVYFHFLSICYEKRVNIQSTKQSDGEPRAVFISF